MVYCQGIVVGRSPWRDALMSAATSYGVALDEPSRPPLNFRRNG